MQPCFPDGLDRVEASYDSASGRYVSNWHRKADRVKWEVAVPANCSADIRLPKKLFPSAPRTGKGILSVTDTADEWVVEAGSGSFTFGK